MWPLELMIAIVFFAAIGLTLRNCLLVASVMWHVILVVFMHT